MRIPKEISDMVKKWNSPGRVYISRPGNPHPGLNIYIYNNGEERQVYTSDGPHDYYLWSVHRQHRIQSWKRARDMWEHARTRLEKSPDKFGLVQS